MAAAKIESGNAIVTRNQRDFAQSSIKTLIFEELFKLIEAERGIAYEEMPL